MHGLGWHKRKSVVSRVQKNRAPTTADTGHHIGTMWVYGSARYFLSSIAGGVAVWSPIGGGLIKDHGSVGVDTEIDLSEGDVHLLTLTAVAHLTFTGWAPSPVASSATLILVDSGDWNPTWPSLLQTEGEADFTYVADKTIVLEFLNVLGGDYVPYMGFQVAADMFGSALSVELTDDGGFADTANWTESANMAVTGGQLVLTTATAEATVEAAPFVAVAGAAYLVTTVIDEVTTAGGGVKMNVGSTDGVTHTTVGTHAEVIVATDTDGLEIIAAGAAMTAKIGSVSVKRFF